MIVGLLIPNLNNLKISTVDEKIGWCEMEDEAAIILK